MTPSLPLGLLAVAVSPESMRGDTTPVVLLTKYREHRFYVTPVTEDGQQLTLATDTGGGQSFIYRDVAERLQLTIEDFKGTVGRLKIPIPPSARLTWISSYARYLPQWWLHCLPR